MKSPLSLEAFFKAFPENHYWSRVYKFWQRQLKKDPRASTQLALSRFKRWSDQWSHQWFGYQEGLITYGVKGNLHHLKSNRSALTRQGVLYVPHDSPKKFLLVMLHGCMQSASSFAELTEMNRLAEELGFCVLYPNQDIQENPMQCWNWHEERHQQREGGEPEVLHELMEQSQALLGMGPNKTFLVGLSAGGALSALMTRLFPEAFAAQALVAAPMPWGTQGLQEAIVSLKEGPLDDENFTWASDSKPLLLVHGFSDEVVHIKHAWAHLKHQFQDHPGLHGLYEQMQIHFHQHWASAERRLSQEWSMSNEVVLEMIAHEKGLLYILRHKERGNVLMMCVFVDGLNHAWSGGKTSEVFSQEGFSCSALTACFCNHLTHKRKDSWKTGSLLTLLGWT